jgi:prepilin-type N-terminal cleavage/methylation domain-containing protein
MALKLKATRSRQQRGMSLIELMIAIAVLTIGVAGCAVVIPIAIGRNFANRQQGNSTVIAQMVTEKLLSVPANTVPVLTITDCAGNDNLVTTTGSAGGSGAAVLASGDIDFTQAPPAGYFMNYTTCGSNGLQMVYDVRWNIKNASAYVKLIIVSARLKSATSNAQMYSVPVTIRSMAGQGS